MKTNSNQETAAPITGSTLLERTALMTLPACALEAGVSRRFLELEIKRERLRAIKMSTRVCRVRRTDWEKYLESSAT